MLLLTFEVRRGFYSQLHFITVIQELRSTSIVRIEKLFLICFQLSQHFL